MFKAAKYICLLVLAPAFLSAADFENALVPENIIYQEVPAAPKAPLFDRTAPDYLDYRAALAYYSDVAYRAAPGSEDYLEAYAAGNYLREKVDALEARLRAAGQPVPVIDREGAVFKAPSRKVASELKKVFGFGKGTGRLEPVVLKTGFAKIVYVKGSTPFLVQGDSFLSKGEVILTYDDGPAPGEYSREVAENLRANSSSAVFFVLGSKLGAQGKAVIKTEAEKGHFVSVHGYFHATEAGKPFTAYSTQKILSELGGVAGTITSATGVKPGLFRPPYGIIAPDAMKAVTGELGLIPLGWTIDTLDWSIKSPDELYAKTIAMIKERGKGIVLMHDIHPQSREVSRRLQTWLKDNNYKVVSPERITQAFKAP